MIRWDGDHLAVALPGARGLFTTRRGGVSTGPYATLNLGSHVGDDAAAVEVNRERVAVAAGLSWGAFHHAHQVHGATVGRRNERPCEADGQLVRHSGEGAAVFVADCLPILLAGGGAGAALHAGWRSLAAGIVEEGVRALREAGAEDPIEAALGPSARGCCYEVGEEVHEALPGGRTREGNLDLAVIARRRLEEAGVGRVHDIGLCTICSEASLFFSHRRDGAQTGRQAGLLWRA
jgi:polyphenol oxidase